MPSTRASAEAPPRAGELLRLEGFGVRFALPRGEVLAATDVSLSVAAGECLGVVGESGAGKSQVFLGVLGLLAANGRASGSARFEGTELVGLPPAALDRVRGAGVGLVFQDPLTALTPHLTIGAQLTEVLARHAGLGGAAARARACMLLTQVQVSDAARRLTQYPQQLSGGMRQRVVIALALAGGPRLLIADEPTTSLDVTVQAQVLALLANLKRTRGLGLVLITHDLAAVAGVADRVAVMRAGRIVETGPVAQVLTAPRTPYVRALLAQARGLLESEAPSVPAPGPVRLAAHGVDVRYRLPRAPWRPAATLTALEAVSFELHAGEGLGVVGESGSGKSTLARAALGLLRATRGRIVWLGRDPAALGAAAVRALRRDVQPVFQDPLGSLDPRMTVAEILAEPLRVHEPQLDHAARTQAVTAALARVALSPALAARYPHELSGGQAQRVGVARAMILQPKVLVCDEPLSALDGPTQAQIVALLGNLVRASGTALLLVSHNLALVQRLCSRALVLYLGRRMELAPTTTLFATPRHPYTRELLAAIPGIDPAREPARLAAVRAVEPPSPFAALRGCAYAGRCAHAVARCREQAPAWEASGAEAQLACHRWKEI